MLPFRSLLFSPGSDARKLARAATSGADALIYDLEDAVAPSARARARRAVADALARTDGPPVFVRPNHPDTGEMHADLDAAVGPHLYGVVLPKVETVDEVRRLDEALAEREARHGMAQGSVVVLPLVESCRGLRVAYDIAVSSPRIVGLAFSSGEDGDFMADLQGEWTPGGEAMMYPRSRLVCDTRAAGLGWPVDGVCMTLDDGATLERECRLARVLGYQAKMAIHPAQLPAIHRAFTPSADDVARSRELLAAYARAEDDGSGAVRHDGRMVDRANVLRAERVIARADAIAALGAGHR